MQKLYRAVIVFVREGSLVSASLIDLSLSHAQLNLYRQTVGSHEVSYSEQDWCGCDARWVVYAEYRNGYGGRW